MFLRCQTRNFSQSIYKARDLDNIESGVKKLASCSSPRKWHFLYLIEQSCVSSLLMPTGFLIGIMGGGVQLGPLGTAATSMPTVPAPGDYDDGEIGGMIGKENPSIRRKPAPVPLCPPQTPHAARTRTRAAAVGSQRLTTWATARPVPTLIHSQLFSH
jgi:hypothetical protein